MDKLVNIMQQKIGPVAERITSNKVIKAISGGFNMMMSIIIVGALFSLLSSLNIGGYQNFLAATGIGSILSLAGKFTTDMIGIYAAFTIGYAYMKNENMTEYAVSAGIFSVFSFFIMTPLSTIEENTYLAFDYLGAAGLFTAIFTGLITGLIFTLCIKRNMTIKMPNGTPPMISKSFGAILPGVFVTLLALVVAFFFSAVFKCSATEALYKTISTPFASLTGSIYTYIIFIFLISLFWCFGIHGGQIFMPFIIMTYMSNGVENQAAFAAGDPLPHIITVGLFIITLIGGNGNTLGLCIDMLLFSKSKQYKTLGKLAIVPSLCGINEPILFGAPIVMNPILGLPFIFVPVINAIVAYNLINIGIVSGTRMAMEPLGTPVFLDSFLMCGVTGILLTVVLTVISAICYFPFMKVQDNIAWKKENEAN